MERLVRREEYATAKRFIVKLRAKSDPAPQVVKPSSRLRFPGAKRGQCVLNAARFARENADYEPVIGLKLWVMWSDDQLPAVVDLPFVAPIHCVVRHKQSGAYLDLTPADEGDEGKEMIFVPSSLVYEGWTIDEMATYVENDLQLRFGGVCEGLALHFKRDSTSSSFPLFKETPGELELFMCPLLSSVARHLGREAEELRRELEKAGGALDCVDGKLYCIISANSYRSIARAGARPSSD